MALGFCWLTAPCYTRVMRHSLYGNFLSALVEAGLSKRQAAIVLAEYVEADRVGHGSHGLRSLPSMLQRLAERRGPVKVVKDSGAITFLDGQKELGQLAAVQAVEIAAKKARRYGVSLVGLKNILPFRRPGTYAAELADRGFIGIVMNDGGRAKVTHPDSPEPVVGTNPIGIGIPTSRGPLVIDMATAKRAWAEVGRAAERGALLSPNTYKDHAGKITRDPSKAFSVIPFGEYKGFALAIVVEILSNGLLSMTMGKRKKAVNHLAAARGSIFIAIDPRKFISLTRFRRAVSRFLREIKASKKNPGVRHLRVPGEATLRH